MSKDKVIDILTQAGFKEFTPLDKVKNDLKNIEHELYLISLLNKYFILNPNNTLIHPVYGELNKGSKLISSHHKKVLEKNKETLEIELKKLVKKQRITKKYKEVNFQIIENEELADDKLAEVVHLYKKD